MQPVGPAFPHEFKTGICANGYSGLGGGGHGQIRISLLNPCPGDKVLILKGMPIHGVTNLCSQTEAVEFANDVAELWKQQLGQRLVGVYLIGSLAHGGFNARYSDIDMALIAEVRNAILGHFFQSDRNCFTCVIGAKT